MTASLDERYCNEAPTPEAPTMAETIGYIFEENHRRSYQSTRGLTDADLSVDPGHGAWSIGEILKHQLRLVGLIIENLKPGATADLGDADIGEQGAWNLAAIVERREALAERFREVFPNVNPGDLMAKRPEAPPKQWADRPVLMRILRPLTDLATHTGQVTYARRQFDRPVGS